MKQLNIGVYGENHLCMSTLMACKLAGAQLSLRLCTYRGERGDGRSIRTLALGSEHNCNRSKDTVKQLTNNPLSAIDALDSWVKNRTDAHPWNQVWNQIYDDRTDESARRIFLRVKGTITGVIRHETAR